MSIDLDTSHSAGFPELTALGKRIEVLRIQRGLSKQHLARYAETSRQQLWRVMTGKSELTPSLKQRLVDVLGASEAELEGGETPRSAPVRSKADGASFSATAVSAKASTATAARV